MFLSPNEDLVEVAYEVIGNLDNQIQTFEIIRKCWKIYELIDWIFELHFL